MHIKPLNPFNLELETAPDKSITHRAIMFNAFAKGSAKVTNALLGEDCLSTIKCLRTLGVEIEVDGSTVYIKGGLSRTSGLLDAGNSGTTARLMSGMLAGRGISATVTGDESLSSRPMMRVINPLSAMGSKISANGGKLPIEIVPAELQGIEYEMPHASAQVKSAVLLAGLSASGSTKVIEPILSRNHTEIMLGAMGADIKTNGKEITVRRSELNCIDIHVVGDISSAAYLIGLALVTRGSEIRVCNVGLNSTRTGMLDVLRQMGADMEIIHKGGIEPYGDIIVRNAPLKPFAITSEQVPSLIDELPLLAGVACYADGTSVISGAGELKVKESNRIDTTVAALKALGADIEGTDDGMIIKGRGGLRGGGLVECHADHRIALSAAVAGSGSELGCEIDDPQCADISYPEFFAMLGDMK